MVILEGSLSTDKSDELMGKKSFNTAPKLFNYSILSLYDL